MHEHNELGKMYEREPVSIDTIYLGILRKEETTLLLGETDYSLCSVNYISSRQTLLLHCSQFCPVLFCMSYNTHWNIGWRLANLLWAFCGYFLVCMMIIDTDYRFHSLKAPFFILCLRTCNLLWMVSHWRKVCGYMIAIAQKDSPYICSIERLKSSI